MREGARPGAKDLLAVLALLACTFAAYAGVMKHDFVFYDDNAYVFENPMVRGGFTAEGVEWAFTSSHSANWHPLTWLSHMLDCELWGTGDGAAGKHHRTNLILHALNALLLYGFLRYARGAFWPSLAVAMLFALHPLRVESVAWVSERKDVLAGLFWMTTMLSWAWYARRPARGRYAVVVLSLALGLMAKPMLVTLPFVLLLLDAWPLGRFRGGEAVAGKTGATPPPIARRLILEKVPLLLLAVASSVITAVVQHRSGVVRTTDALALGARLANAATSYVTYLWKTVWPTNLAFFHPHPALYDPEGFSPLGATVIGSVLLLVVVTALVLRHRKRAPFLAVGWFWYLGTLVPVIGVVQVGEQAYAERYAYLPLVGIYMALAWGIAALVTRWRIPGVPVLVAGTVVVAACAVVTRAQTRYWRDSETLFEHALAVTDRNYIAELNLGYYLWRRGRRAEAREHYSRAEEIKPDAPRINYNLGVVAQTDGDDAEAIRRFEAVLRVIPDHADAHQMLGGLYARRRDFDRALRHFREAVRIAPDSAENHSNLARMYRLLQNPAAAVEELREALRLRPEMNTERMDLGACLAELGRHGEAVQQYREVLRRVPSSAATALKLAWLLATSRDDHVRDGVEALRLARALSAPGPQERFEVLSVLAAALAETGDFDGAVRSQEQALRFAPEARRAELRGRLEQFLSRRPIRE